MKHPTQLPALFPLLWQPLIRRALEEDLGRAGDLTTDAIVAPELSARAQIVARRAGRLAGLEPALGAFSILDANLQVEQMVQDGCDVEAGALLARIEGPARPLLAAERTALNMLGRLSGIATVTRDLAATVNSVERPGKPAARVVCTRKTTPGLRALEKYAVRAGGGSNHRFGLDDAVLIKDNHVAIAGSLTLAIERVRAHVGHMVKVQAEVDTLEQLDEALALGVDAVLLDNMSVQRLTEAVERAAGRCITEASGGITPQTAATIAATGVDQMSVGWLTHSAPSLDVGLDVELT